LRGLRIVSAGLLAGVTLFLAVALMVKGDIGKQRNELVSYIACGLCLLSLPIASVLRAARFPREV